VVTNPGTVDAAEAGA